ncbi:unnamed protein product [Sphenostylis stenocarpa]|uniref:Uncharacterized protein n=1 Tax=Sphenostylis stenocarpa TaxID=92480 RepID=A0AA86SP45_9FABA|nr:unnamed protein product [Sphenostylis stenocarpa]
MLMGTKDSLDIFTNLVELYGSYPNCLASFLGVEDHHKDMGEWWVEAFSYALQEEFVADQLFQSSDHLADEILRITHSIFSSSKVLEAFYSFAIINGKEDDISPFVSSIFTRRLLLPGVHHNATLYATLVEYSRHLAESELQTLTVDGIKKEILSVIEQENNALYGLLVDSSSDAVGLIRKNSISLFRSLEDIERIVEDLGHPAKKDKVMTGKENPPLSSLEVEGGSKEIFFRERSGGTMEKSCCEGGIDRIRVVGIDRKPQECAKESGSSDEVSELTGLVDIFDDDLECEILIELLRCVLSFSQQLGKTASSIFYESLLTTPVISSEDIIRYIVKILETGYCKSGPVFQTSTSRDHIVLDKELADHKSLRKLSVDMFLSLQGLLKKASAWGRILNVIEGFLKFLVPKKVVQNFNIEVSSSINSSVVVHITYQIAKVMFESAWDFLLFLSYLVDISGQVHLTHDDINKVQLELVPMLQETIFEWLIIMFFTITPSAPAAGGSSTFLSRSIDLAFILFKHSQYNAAEQLLMIVEAHLQKEKTCQSIQDADGGWCIRHHLLGCCLLSQVQFGLHATQKDKKVSDAIRLAQVPVMEAVRGRCQLCMRKHPGDGAIELTFWTIQYVLYQCITWHHPEEDFTTIHEPANCKTATKHISRSSSGNGASEALQSLSDDLGILYLGFSGCTSIATWKLQYYQWAMQLFERYSISEGACQFALAALEQVDEALHMKDDKHTNNSVNESVTTIKGRLWANVFIFALDLGRYYDAYCAIISNPDEESKYICLRRFIIVLYEQGAIKVGQTMILCSNKLPLIGLVEKVEQELAWKAERSDISAKPNLYKLLYAFQMHRHNWRHAANYIYMYSARLRTEAALKDSVGSSLMLQERLNAISAAINALHLVHPAYAWIDSLAEGNSLVNEHHPSKKAKRSPDELSAVDDDADPQAWESSIDIEKLENEFVLTSAEYMLSLVNVKWTFSGKHGALSDLADLLVQNNLYDMAFTVLLRFFKGSSLKRELERVLSAISLKCCLDKVESTWVEEHSHLLTSSKNEIVLHGSPVTVSTAPRTDRNSHWATLKLYLERYKEFNGRLPMVVAETLLRADPKIELPLWLVQLFKEGQKERLWGMTGRESNPASLFQLYVTYDRYAEATYLLLECMDSFASMRPADIIRRKRPFAVWFPYTTIERLLYRLDELIRMGHMVDHCDKLKRMLLGSLQSHLKMLKVDSDDAVSVTS